MSIVISTLRREVVSLFLRAVLIRFCATISSGNCEVSNSEVERHFPPREIRFQFFFCFVDDFIRFTLKITRGFPLGHCYKEI